MNNILIKTPGEVVDQLITTSLKIFWLIEKEKDESLSMEERFNAGQAVLALNKKRSELIKALNELLGVENPFDIKT